MTTLTGYLGLTRHARIHHRDRSDGYKALNLGGERSHLYYREPTPEEIRRAEEGTGGISAWLSSGRDLTEYAGKWVAIGPTDGEGPCGIKIVAGTAKKLDRLMSEGRRQGQIYMPLRVPTREEAERGIL